MKKILLIFSIITINVSWLNAMDNNECFNIHNSTEIYYNLDKTSNNNSQNFINFSKCNTIDSCNINEQTNNTETIVNKVIHRHYSPESKNYLSEKMYFMNNIININNNKKRKYNLKEYIQYIKQYTHRCPIDMSKLQAFIGEWKNKYSISTWKKYILEKYEVKIKKSEKYIVKNLSITKDGFNAFTLLSLMNSMPLQSIPEETNISNRSHSSNKSINYIEENNEEQFNGDNIKKDLYNIQKQWENFINQYKTQIFNKDIENKFIKLISNIDNNSVEYSDKFLYLLQYYDSYDIEYLNNIKDILSQKSVQTRLEFSFKHKKINNLEQIIKYLRNKNFNSEHYRLICNIISLTLFEFQSFQEIYNAIYDSNKNKFELQDAVNEFVNIIQNPLLFEIYIRTHNNNDNLTYLYNILVNRNKSKILNNPIKMIELQNKYKMIAILNKISRNSIIQDIQSTLFK